MAQYYYLTASLFLISYDSDSHITTEEFIEQCKSWLDEKDFSILLNTSIYDPPTKSISFRPLNLWWEWETSLRNELVKLRSAKLNMDGEKYQKSAAYIFDIPGISRHAIEEDSPLKAEHYLNRARWAYLEGLKQDHFFDLDNLVIYYLQLQLLERRNKFKFETGLTNYQKTCREVLKNHELY